MADQVKTDISDIVQVAQKQRRRQQMDLEKLERYGMLTPTGKNWLIQAVDPFHDSEIPHTGFPDLSCSSSVTQCIQVSGNIQCPSAITTGTWDCNIVAWPEVSNVATTTNKVGLSVRLPVPFVMTNSSTTTSAYPIGGVSAVPLPQAEAHMVPQLPYILHLYAVSRLHTWKEHYVLLRWGSRSSTLLRP